MKLFSKEELAVLMESSPQPQAEPWFRERTLARIRAGRQASPGVSKLGYLAAAGTLAVAAFIAGSRLAAPPANGPEGYVRSLHPLAHVAAHSGK